MKIPEMIVKVELSSLTCFKMFGVRFGYTFLSLEKS